MKHPKKLVALGLLGLLILLSLFGGVGQVSVRGAQAEPAVLARVEVSGMIDELGLPVYAHLQDAAGRDYALVIASPAQLNKSGASYQVLDRKASGAAYVIALERRAGARLQAAQAANVLHDDGQHVIARATPDQAEALVALGFEIEWLSDAPLVLTAPKTLAVEPEAIEYDPVIADMINQVQQNTVYTYDGNLSGEWSVSIGGSNYTITTRYTNSGTPIQKATQYVYEHMQALGLTVSYHDWTYYTTSNRNVIGAKTGTIWPVEIVLVTAHLDDVPSSGLAPGADDNASGSVGVMVAADIMSQYQFGRTVRFVFFTGEEQGLYGSRRYAELVAGAGDNIVAVYNMDMIAWDALDGPTLRLHTRTTSNPGYPGDRAIADLFVDVVNTYGLSSYLTPIIDADGITASDHSSFWSQGYSAILAIEDDQDDFCSYYHTSSDRLSTLNMTYFTNYVKASVGTAAHLAYYDDGSPPPPTPTPTDTPTPEPVQPILLVDDDTGSTYESYYTAALNALGKSYNTWNVQNQGSPSAAELQLHQIVIWFTGDDYTATLTSADTANLTTYLNGGGRLFITGQDIGYDISTDPFYANYLHASYVLDDTNTYGLTGYDIMSGLNVNISGGDGANNQSYPSEIGLGSGAVGLYDYDGSYGWGGLRWEGAYKVVYFSFGYEAINAAASRSSVMSAVLSWLEGGAPPPTPTPTSTPTPTVTPTPTSTLKMFVHDIAMSGIVAGKNRSATAVITIWDTNNNPVGSATVYGTWSGDYNASVSGATLADGTVSFTSGKVKLANATFTFTVDDVVKSGITYDPALNNETSDTIVVP